MVENARIMGTAETVGLSHLGDVATEGRIWGSREGNGGDEQ